MEKSGIVSSDVAHNSIKLYNINIEFTSIVVINQNMKEGLFIYCIAFAANNRSLKYVPVISLQ